MLEILGLFAAAPGFAVDMAGLVKGLSFLIFLIVVIVIAAIVLWEVQRFFPEVYPPARLIVGAVAIISILYALLRVVQGGVPALP